MAVAAENPAATAAIATDVAETVLPDIPPSFVQCLEKAITPGKSADEKVQNVQAAATSRQSCGRAIVAWYKNLQKTKKTAATKTAAAAPKAAPAPAKQ